MLYSFLSSFLHSPWMLLGLGALAIPVIIHLLNRRRYDVVDWGAMQFLQISEVTRRRLMLEEVLLLLLRMALLAVLVLALAGPFFETSFLSRLAGSRPNRDVVLVFDGSASMAATDETGRRSPQDLAREWALAFLDALAPGDTVAVLQAKQQVVPVVATLSRDLKAVRQRIKDLPAPAGGCDWPGALKRAHQVLADSKRSEREIIVLGDGQRFGWADPDTLFRWELLAGELGANRPEAGDDPPRPRLWAVNLAPDRAAGVPNWALAPLAGNRPGVPVEREVTFRTDLLLTGQAAYAPPHRLRLEVDGKPVRDLPAPQHPKIDNGKVPLSFPHRFAAPGSHLVSLILDADPPPEERKPGYVVRDRVPGDNRQDFAVEVLPAVPVLLIDGETSAAPSPYRATDFLRDALSPARDRTPAVRARVVPLKDFSPALLSAAPRPRVLVLHNVPRLEGPQQEALGRFLADGGGVLVTLGERVEADFYNEQLYRGGDGWLPARLDGIEGDEARPKDAARPDPASFTHPTLELFRKLVVGGLGEAYFPRWWKLSTPGQHAAGVPVGTLRTATARYPFLVERAVAAGRVLLCAVPLDNSWGTNLPDLPAFVPLAHELVYYLAGARSAEHNLRPGQPLRYRAQTREIDPSRYTLQPPGGAALPLSTRPGVPDTYPAQVRPLERGALLIYEDARETGVYRLQTPEGATVYYVVQPDARESDLTPCSEEDRARVAKLLPVQYENDRGFIIQTPPGSRRREDYWQYFLVGLIGLLALEVWLTRRMVRNQQLSS
jgi:hypothetical protein